MQKETIKQFLVPAIIAIFIISLGVFYASKSDSKATIFATKSDSTTIVKKEVIDARGCNTSRGYMWDAKNKKCVNPWEGISKEKMVAGANPFAERCVEDGGTSKQVKDESGKFVRSCIFKGQICDEKLYFSGTCFK